MLETAGGGGKPAERVHGDVERRPRRCMQPSESHRPAWLVCRTAQPTCGASAAAAAARSWSACRWVLLTWPQKKICVAPYRSAQADQKITAQLRRETPPPLRRDSEPRELQRATKSAWLEAAQSLRKSYPQGVDGLQLGCFLRLCKRPETLRQRNCSLIAGHSVREGHSWGVGSYCQL